jgi:diguanylate cyclase (GGDEF)-like protein
MVTSGEAQHADSHGVGSAWTGGLEDLLSAVPGQQVLLWLPDADGTLQLSGSRGIEHSAQATPDAAAGLFDIPPLLVRTPPNPDQPARALLAVNPTGADQSTLQRLLDEAFTPPPPLDTWDVLEAIGDQAAVLDAGGVVIRANCAWRQTPEAAQSAVPRCEPGVDYPAHLRLTSSRPARIAADGILSVLRGALPAFQSDYDAGERAYSLQVEPLPHGGALVRHVDISFRQHLQRQLAHRATHDALTGLPNRMVMADRLGQALIRAARTGSTVAVLFCDVDRFKQINDTQGHSVGDQVLAAMARRLQRSVRQADLVARFGGDEFVVLLEDIDTPATAQAMAKSLQATTTSPIVVDGRPLHFGVSCGIAVHAGTSNPDLATIDGLLSDADSAMYAAKQTGRGRIALFEPAHRYVRRDPELIAPALRTAADNDEIRMMVQPIVALGTGQVSGFETFVRWDLPEVGLLSPADFLQTAEETGAIVEIGASILRQSLAFATRLPGQVVSINVSWVELAQPAYADSVLDALRAAGLPPERLALEVNVPALAEPQALTHLDQLRTAGLGVTLDAFGRQPVELSILPHLSATAVKIDRTLTAFATQPGSMARMLRGLVGLVAHLGLTGIAEGIESREQAEAAAELGLAQGQGFYFGKPVEPEEALVTVSDGPSAAPW